MTIFEALREDHEKQPALAGDYREQMNGDD